MAADEAFAVELSRLRDAAGLTHQDMIDRGKEQDPPFKFTEQQLSDWFTGKVKTPKATKAQDFLIGVLEAEAGRRDRTHQRHDIGWWRALRKAQRDSAGGSKRQPLGRLIGELTEEDALRYGVHRAIRTEQADVPLLPRYVMRGLDSELRSELTAAKTASRVVMLVGDSSTGKTRACWEAIRAVLADWRLWHPLTPDRPEAVIEQLTAGRVEPRTVIWLNESQMYLRGGSGKRVATALQQLSHGGGGPILVLGSMWPQYWDEMTDSRSAQHTAARELLNSCRRIYVPPDFTESELAGAEPQTWGDDRLQAAAAAPDVGITQYLAGGPELIRRYEGADEYRKAIVHAALDAQRCGQWLHLPAEFLSRAALGYLTERALGRTDDAGRWFKTALKTLTKECHGADGILAPRKTQTAGADSTSKGYKLADYVEQHIRWSLPAVYPPSSFWSAANRTCSDPEVLGHLATEAFHSGRLHRSAVLNARAVELGDPGARLSLAAQRDIVRDSASAVRLARDAAELGDIDAMMFLAFLLEARHPVDLAAAEEFYQEAAEQGHPRALGALAKLRALIADRPRAEEYARYLAEEYADGPHDDEYLPDEPLETADAYAAAARQALRLANVGNPMGLFDLSSLRYRAGDHQGARLLLRYGLNDDGSPASPWSIDSVLPPTGP